MKTQQIIQVWKNYAIKLVATGVPLANVVAALNANNKHRAEFKLSGDRITYRGYVVVSLYELTEKPAAEVSAFLDSLTLADARSWERHECPNADVTRPICEAAGFDPRRYGDAVEDRFCELIANAEKVAA